MQQIAARFKFLFGSTRGLILVAIALVSLTVVIFGMLSGPMADLGFKDPVVRGLGMQLLPEEREARIFMLYHVLAMAIVAVEVYLITALVPMRRSQQVGINATVTAGYISAMIFGLLFAYFGRNFVFHGIFIFGQSLIFFAGLMLATALWPWKRDYLLPKGSDYSRGPGGISLERTAFFVMAVTMLGSALFGAIPGSLFGNGFESFLAENVVREPVTTNLQLAVIGHLHIMLTLIGVAVLLILSRWIDFKGILHKIAMPPLIGGTIVVTMGVWLLIPVEGVAHIIIYGGSTLVLPAALFLVIYGWRKLIRDQMAARGVTRWNFWQGLRAMVADPLKFGVLWQMVYMNFVVSFVGIFMAIKLDEIIRVWPAREERITLVGHWHILATLIATILLLHYADYIGLKGKARQWFGWVIIIGSNIAFAAVTLFQTKRLYVSETGQESLVALTTIIADIGLVMVLVVLGVFLFARLFDLFRGRGRWAAEMAAEETESGVGE